MAIHDVRMTESHAYAANGILDLGKCTDTGCIGALPGVPTSGYLDSVDFSYAQLGHLFAIRTAEMNYALLYYRGMGSGLPFNDFRWAYQPDGTPDFNKPIVPVLHEDFRSGLQKGFIALKAMPKGVAYRVAQAGRIRIELFDLKGKYVSMIADHYHDCGEYYIDFHNKSFAPSVYFVKCSQLGRMDRKLVFPLVIR
jgi:hypothetical protein